MAKTAKKKTAKTVRVKDLPREEKPERRLRPSQGRIGAKGVLSPPVGDHGVNERGSVSGRRSR